LRRCSSLKLKARSTNFAVILGALREKRTTIIAWFFAGAIAMYFEAIAIAAELRDYPGGPEALAKSIMPTIEGMRIIRWPADRLDTLGGYLTYHNVILFNFFLALFAAVQGARLMRHLEENKDIDFYLSTGISRRRLISLRSIAYFLSQILISLGLGAGTAYALATSNAADTKGSFITLLAGGICIFPFFGLGVLISQFLSSARTASGATSIVVTALYLLGNIADKYSWLTWIKYLSPFNYANWSRPVIPGFGVNYISWLAMLLVGVFFIVVAVQIADNRDIGSVAFARADKKKKMRKSSSFVPKTLVGDILYRQRVGLIAWTVVTTLFITVFVSMMSGIVDIWNKFAFLQQFASAGFGSDAAQQYLAMVYEILPPFLAGFVITQSSKWSTDLSQGRVQLFLSTPVSWSGLILRRIAATMIGVEFLIIFSLTAIAIGSKAQGAGVYPSAILRVFVMTNLFSLAFASLSAILVSLLRGRSSTQIVSIYVGAAWMITFMVPYLKWPSWVIRFSIFDAIGHPFVKWPGNLNIILILVVAIPGLILAMQISERTSKSA
jgi:ABC-2 type transport system permease protein